MKAVGAFLALLLLVTPSLVFGANSWSWVSAASDADGWFITSGLGEINIKGNQFEGSLYDKDLPAFLRMTIKGTIKNGHVHAEVVIQGSDAGTETFEGTLKKVTMDNGVVVRQIINLTDGFNMIGLSTGG